MRLSIETRFAFMLDELSDVLVQCEAAATSQQMVLESAISFAPTVSFSRVSAQDEIGERIWLHASGAIEVTYQASIDIQRSDLALEELQALEPHELPGETVPYLFDTRYCLTEEFQPFVEAEFSKESGGARIAALRDWIAENFTYEPGTSTADTTALDSFVERRGVCRDYAHVLISLARASSIPARYVACYCPTVDPPDFHAAVEVLLKDPARPTEGKWYLVDATGMSTPASTAIIGVGRDAADVSFLTTFGQARFDHSSVTVQVDE